MSTATPGPDAAPPAAAVEARFRALASCVPEEDWNKLVSGTAEAILRRLAACGAVDGATQAALETGYRLVGELLVDYTNVVLTSVAAGLETKGGDA